MTVGDLLRLANEQLPASSSRLSEAEQIVLSVLNSERIIALCEPSQAKMELYSRMKDSVIDHCRSLVMERVRQRISGQPLQYVLGGQYFLDHYYEVGPGVLIPRPETEVLVQAAVDRLAGNGDRPFLGLELGLGSGIISIELLHRFSGLRMFASEVSINAVEYARRNALSILGAGSGRLTMLAPSEPADIWTVFEAALGEVRADFFISNPPYLCKDADEVEARVQLSEPEMALFPPPHDLLFYYRSVAEGVRHFLKPGGWVLMELPHERSTKTLNLFQSNCRSADVLLDLTGRPRVLVAQLI